MFILYKPFFVHFIALQMFFQRIAQTGKECESVKERGSKWCHFVQVCATPYVIQSSFFICLNKYASFPKENRLLDLT